MVNTINHFIPFKGTAEITFNMNRATVHSILKEPFKHFKRGSATTITDFFPARGIFVEYDEYDICHSISFTNESNLIYDSQNLFHLKFSDLVEHYNKRSFHKEIEENKGITYHDLGFGVSKIDGEDIIESIIIFRDDYWK